MYRAKVMNWDQIIQKQLALAQSKKGDERSYEYAVLAAMKVAKYRASF